MKSSFLVSLLLVAVLAVGGSILVARAGPVQAGPVQAGTASVSGDTVTVFVDATLGFRKKHMANQLTKSHAEYAARGYRYVDMAPYTENGDLVGFFVTYTRQ
ncbi:MAG TPA: hypothetical protein VL545_04505 [Rhodanobacter sp.]|jgi:hypothetical protein|nr:hypothetical protein [Rhodanobacter sp.]